MLATGSVRSGGWVNRSIPAADVLPSVDTAGLLCVPHVPEFDLAVLGVHRDLLRVWAEGYAQDFGLELEGLAGLGSCEEAPYSDPIFPASKCNPLAVGGEAQ